MIPLDYIKEYVSVPKDLLECKVWNTEEKTMELKCIEDVTLSDTVNGFLLYPIGKKDDNGYEIYYGDLLEVEIYTKDLTFVRVGVVRREGMYAAGIDYLDGEGNLEGDGDFIDEFYINKKKIIGNIFEGLRTFSGAKTDDIK